MIFEFLLNIEIEKLELDQAKYATFETMDSKPLDLFFLSTSTHKRPLHQVHSL